MNIEEPTKNTTNSETKYSWLNCLFLSYNRRQNCWDIFSQMRYFEEQNNLHPPLSPSFYAGGVRCFLQVVRTAPQDCIKGVGKGKLLIPFWSWSNVTKALKVSQLILLPIVTILWSFSVVSGKFLNLSVVADSGLVRKQKETRVDFLSPKSDKHQFSPNSLNTTVKRIGCESEWNDHQREKCFDLLSNSLYLFVMVMYRDQFGEFVCAYWSLRELQRVFRDKTALFALLSFFRTRIWGWSRLCLRLTSSYGTSVLAIHKIKRYFTSISTCF